MRIYAHLWVAVCAPLAVVGLCVGLVFAPIPVTALALFCGTIAAIVTWVWLGQSKDATCPSRATARLVAENALIAGSAIGAVIGFAALLGIGVLLLLILILAISPYVVKTSGRWLHSVLTPSPAQLDSMARALSLANHECSTFQSSSGVAALSDEKLCETWRASYTALQHQPSAAQTAALVAERQTYLDELQRRNPRGFAAWLASEARAPSNPLPYLTRGRADQPPINWDELTRGQDR